MMACLSAAGGWTRTRRSRSEVAAGLLAVAAIAVATVTSAAGCHMGANQATPPHAVSTAAASGSATASASGALRSPIDVESRRALVGRPVPDLATHEVARPIRDINGVSFYVDAEKSIADPLLKEQNVAALRPLRDFVADELKLADDWMVSRPASPAHAWFALEGLYLWAKAGALLGNVNRQGAYEREWTLGSLAWAYLKVREAPGLDAGKRQTVESWLRTVAAAVQPNYERPSLTSNANNHAYWVGLAVATVAVACNDRALFDWGLARARIGITQVAPDGVLPLEAARQTKAFHYHVFALTPLVMLAELAAANGIGLYDEGNGAIARLADLVISGFAAPVSFADRMGGPQEISSPPKGTDLAWAEPYAARFPDGRLGAWLRAARPVSDVRIGGDMTASFGRGIGDRL